MKSRAPVRSLCAAQPALVRTVWPGSKMKHISQVMQPEWDLGRNEDVYEKQKAVRGPSSGRQRELPSEDSVFQPE